MSTLETAPVEVKPGPWKMTRETFYRLLESGVYGDNPKLELIGGTVTTDGMQDRIRQSSTHACALLLVARSLNPVFESGSDVRQQLPLSLGMDTDVEPDISVVVGSPEDYADAHPTTACLVVEVSDSTLRFDRSAKTSLYASAGIPEYWIVNLVERVVEVHRDPVPDPDQPFRARYGTILRLGPDRTINPLAAPNREIRTADLIT